MAQRLPRYRRADLKEQPRFRIQERGREIVALVHDYRVIPSDHIQRLVPGSDQKFCAGCRRSTMRGMSTE